MSIFHCRRKKRKDAARKKKPGKPFIGKLSDKKE